MKIISGLYKGRNIKGFNIDGTRPTQDRIKENLFNMINYELEDKIVLDLFSGSGNLGIEALSRGANFTYFVDNNNESIKIIKENINNLNIKNCKVIKNDYLKALSLIDKVDIVFLDPPYKTNYIEKAINKIESLNILNNNGLIICETDSLDKIVYSDRLEIYKTKQYSDKYIVILKKIC